MSTQASLQDLYSNVVLAEVVEAVDDLLREGSSTHIYSIVLGGRQTYVPSLLDLRGLGKEIWGKEDAQTYVNKLRDAWNK